VARHLADALAKGARALVGGQVEERDGGRYVQPTVLVDVDHTMEVMREETFGPVLPIMRVRDAEEAIRLANDSSYGLGASVFTGDVARGRAIARRLESGAVCINDASVNFLALELPMGGWKSSGVGSRHGPDGIRKFTKPQALVVTDGAPGREPYMYPYSAEATTQIRAMLQRAFGEASGG
jgi:acyl-CoA reductase-like NAD-dependent aldehyde dehydrogenase